VGATWFLPRLPGELGTYCALTGDRLDAADGLGCGIATHRVRSARFAELVEALCGAVPVDAVLAAFTEPVDAGALALQRPAIDRWFSANHVEEILASLDASAAEPGGEGGFAGTAAAAIREKSPLSLKLALALQRRGRTLAFDECMRTEYRVVSRVVRGHDFYEGIRAVIIDKDQAPKWRPSALAAISQAEIEAHFAPVARELDLSELDLPELDLP
jgi:enoyl-CoA hydratase